MIILRTARYRNIDLIFQKNFQAEMQSEREILLEKVNLAETRCAEADNEVVELRAHVTSKDQTEEALRRQITDLKALVGNEKKL